MGLVDTIQIDSLIWKKPGFVIVGPLLSIPERFTQNDETCEWNHVTC